MPNLKILVAEDNPIHADKIEMLLNEIGYDFIGAFSNSTEVLRNFHATKPDVVLLDIELEGNSNGIEIAKKINESTPTPIIFITALEDINTMSEANETEPYAYMVKPVEKASLQGAIELAVYKFAKEQEKESQEVPFVSWNQDLLVKDSFFIKTGNKLERVLNESILWIELAESRYCDVQTDSRNYHLRTSLNNLSQKLDSNRFVRIHRKYIVNAEKIDRIDDIDMMVEIANKEFPIGKTYKSLFLKRLKLI